MSAVRLRVRRATLPVAGNGPDVACARVAHTDMRPMPARSS
eukprot:COSAG01_NODE_68271_length_264_cov_1.248485_1_plen_40_part_10